MNYLLKSGVFIYVIDFVIFMCYNQLKIKRGIIMNISSHEEKTLKERLQNAAYKKPQSGYRIKREILYG